MKKVSTLLFILSFAFSTTTFAQIFADNCVKGEVSYQIVSETGSELVFDVFIKEHSASACGSIYLGATDIIFDYNLAAFTAPTITKADQNDPILGLNVGYCTFNPQIPSGAFSGTILQSNYHSATATEVLDGQFAININSPSPSDQATLDNGIAFVTPTGSRIGRYTVTGYAGTGHGLIFAFAPPPPFAGNTVLAQETKAFTFEPTAPFGSYRAELSETVLPIELRKFTAVAANSTDALVRWETALEQNVSHFELQRSSNGDEWATITEQNAQGQGAYAYNDINVYRGTGKETFYYRLRTVDVNGAAQLSEVKAVTFIGRDIDGEVVLSPNPTQNSVVVGLYKAENLEDVTYQITNVHGQLVQEGRIVGQETTIDFELTSGIYFVRLMKNGADVFATQKMVVTNK